MKKRIEMHSVALSFLLVLSVMVMIFCFSAQPAVRSSQTSSHIVVWLLHVLFPNYDSMDSMQQEEIAEIATLLVRKAAHVAEYAMLGFSLMLHLRLLSIKGQIKRPASYAFFIGALYAATDELHQIFVPGRSGEVKDVLLDSSGVLLGILLMLWILKCAERCRKKRRI